ncbi:methyltransferase domain-containing protein [Nesterenkonia aurantiaca]|uniref:2-polyprenyl-3-methyl-5-hydroxy-6-metoxy-1, 4-benzoquinol methylase n=1 Tax=Nesterenkonia aurantiaca TaxID=1436010 RepID=A0A4R7G690_9MICC|nr:methyltransferase domain-containing protein [Nesterenkonia aurantiaca]TDS86881.1 2-polyprenyl-3-methyl-5-hydroxy-6-metoxy-1,4-benzoquinol methylase [Nesterenkonia aurantiaca]
MSPVNLSVRDEQLRELMDDPDCDPVRLDATLRRFHLVNRLISGWDQVYRTRLRPALLDLERPARVLDLGSGGGDVVTRLAQLAARDGLPVEWTGADPDPRAHEAAQKTQNDRKPRISDRQPPRVRFLCADAGALLEQGESFDVVLSNHVLHHLDAPGLLDFTESSRQLCTGTVLHSDIARGRLAYGLFAVGITPLARGTFLRTDGLRSIRRSYQPEELATALAEGWTVTSPAPFRLIAEAPGRG